MTKELPDRPEEPKTETPDVVAAPPARPARPEYGEYATPQEQAKAIARSLPTPSLAAKAAAPGSADSDSPQAGSAEAGSAEPGSESERPSGHWGTLFPRHDAPARAMPTPRTTPAAGSTPVQQDRPFAPPRPSDRNPWMRDTPARPAGALNRLATMILLALGLVYVLGGIPSYLELEQTLNTAYAQWAIGAYTSTALTSSIGIAIVVGQFLIWLVAAFASVRRLRLGKVAWWIPLVAAVLALALSTALMAVLLTSDPAFTTFLTSK